MATQKEIKANITALKGISKEQILREFPEYREMAQQMADLRVRMNHFESSHEDEVDKRLAKIHEQIEELEKLLSETKKNIFVVPEDILNWFFKEYCRGTSYGYSDNEKLLQFVWFSDDKKYAIIRWKGGPEWVGRGTIGYRPTSYFAVKVFGDKHNQICTYEGKKFATEGKAEMIKKIEEYRRK